MIKTIIIEIEEILSSKNKFIRLVLEYALIKMLLKKFKKFINIKKISSADIHYYNVNY